MIITAGFRSAILTEMVTNIIPLANGGWKQKTNRIINDGADWVIVQSATGRTIFTWHSGQERTL